MIEIVNFFGFQQMPFGRSLAPAQLHRHPGHAEAVARLTWCIQTRGLGLLTGECGSGKTVAARAAVAALDPARHTTIYIANPTVGTRGIHHQIVATLGGTRTPTGRSCSPRPPPRSPPSATNAPACPSSSSMNPTCWDTTS